MSKKWRNRFLSFYHSMLTFNWQPFWNYTFTGIYPPMPLLFYLLEFFQTWINSWHACKLEKKLVWPERDLREFRFSNSLKYLLWVIWHTWNIFYCYFFHQIKPTKCECATPLLTIGWWTCFETRIHWGKVRFHMSLVEEAVWYPTRAPKAQSTVL